MPFPAAARRCAVPSLICLLATLPAPARAAEEFTFRYAPPPGTTWDLLLEESQVLELEGVGSQSSQIESKTRFTVERGAEGWTVTAKPVSVRITREGRVVEDPILEALLERVTVKRLDPTGRLRAVEGFEDVAEELRERFPAQVTPELVQALDPEALEAGERAEWEGRIGDLLGRTLELGQVLKGTTRLRVGGRQVECAVETKIEERVPCGARQCLRITSVYRDGDSEPLEPGEMRIRGETERLIDPDTMLIYGESASRTTRTRVELPDGLVSATMNERRRYRYQYDP